ncbi:MAG: pyridoxal-phosphate dependent enzyme, partial [Pseudomonadota bacterium]
AISSLSDKERKTGIVASSSGNHAQGVAEAAKLFDASATIIMPSDAPKLKVERTRSHGAEIVFYDRITGDREGTARAVLEEKGGIFIHPFDNLEVIAGQGTVGLEMAEDFEASGLVPDRVLVCTGGGGLTAGVALAMRDRFPDAIIHSVEPEGFDDYRRSLLSGNRETNEKKGGSVCDAIISPTPGELGFEINRYLLGEGIVISDDEAMASVRFACEEMKLVLEPGGAAALAGLLQAGKRWQGETIAIVLSGGNVDPEVFSRAMA